MEAIKNKLKEVPRSDRAPGCTDEEINQYCDAFTRLLQYMDVLAHFCYQPYGSITDSEMVLIWTLVCRMDCLFWKLSRTIPPKVHMRWHLVDDLERLRGMKHHQESKLEVAHQKGVCVDSRFRSMAGNTRKIVAIAKYEANMDDPATFAVQEQVREARACNFSIKSREKKAVDESEAKRQMDNHIADIMNAPEIDGSFPFLLELTIVDRHGDD